MRLLKLSARGELSLPREFRRGGYSTLHDSFAYLVRPHDFRVCNYPRRNRVDRSMPLASIDRSIYNFLTAFPGEGLVIQRRTQDRGSGSEQILSAGLKQYSTHGKALHAD